MNKRQTINDEDRDYEVEYSAEDRIASLSLLDFNTLKINIFQV